MDRQSSAVRSVEMVWVSPFIQVPYVQEMMVRDIVRRARAEEKGAMAAYFAESNPQKREALRLEWCDVASKAAYPIITT